MYNQTTCIARSSRQGVGTVHASSNIAASLWVIDNMCTPHDWLPAEPISLATYLT